MSLLNIRIGNSILEEYGAIAIQRVFSIKHSQAKSHIAHIQESKLPRLAGEGRGEGDKKGCAFKISLILTFSLEGAETKSLNCGQ